MLLPESPLPATLALFDSHGHTEVSIEGRLILVVAVGRFNLDGCRRFCSLVGDAVDAQGEQPFAMLIDNLRFEGGTPDAYRELDSFNEWLNSRPMVAKAMLIRSEMLIRIMDRLTPSRRRQNIREFSDHAQAMAWLQAQLSADRAQIS
jgi:hypothetical protein